MDLTHEFSSETLYWPTASNFFLAEEFHGQKPADTPAPTPIVTSTHKSIVAEAKEEGAKQVDAQTAKLNAAVAKLREASAPQVQE